MILKSYTIFGVLLLVLLGLTSIAGATVSFTGVSNSASSVTQGNSVTVSFALSENGEDNLTNINFTQPTNIKKGTDSFNSASTIGGVITSLTKNTTSGTMTLIFNVPSSQAVGIYTGDITFTADYNGSSQSFKLPVSITVKDAADDPVGNFCAFEDGVNVNPGNLRVKIKDITVEGLGEDQDWAPLDQIEIEVDIENNGNEDLDNIELEWGIYNDDNDEWVVDVDNVDDFNINEDDDETTTITFTLDEDDLDIDLDELNDGDNYILLVRGTGEVDNTNNDDTCDSDSRDVNIIVERDFVLLNDFQVPESVSCGSNLVVSADLINIGSRDQDDVKVTVTNRDFSINKLFEVGNIDSFETNSLTFDIPIPANAESKSYLFRFEVFDEDNDLFEGDFGDDDVESTFSRTVTLSCSGSGGSTDNGGDSGSSKVLVSANLVSGGDAGGKLVITSNIKNEGSSSATFLVNAEGHGEWADEVNINPSSITLSSEQSGETTFTFDVKDSASGDQVFTIEVVSDGKLVASQPVSVTINPKKSFDFSGIFGDNWYLWLIGLLNVVLIVIIIVVAVRVSRK